MEDDKDRYHSPGHTRAIFGGGFRDLVRRVSEDIVTYFGEERITAVAGCGNSGVPIASAVAITLDLDLIVVRKQTDNMAADWASANGPVVGGRYVILDDLISSGNTVRHIREAISQTARRRSGGKVAPSVPVGIYLYHVTGGLTRYSLPGSQEDPADLTVPVYPRASL